MYGRLPGVFNAICSECSDQSLKRTRMGKEIKNPELVKTRQKEICQAAVKLFSTKGYHNTSIKDIAKNAKISIGSLYDYINNKEDILYLIAKQFNSQLHQEVAKVLESDLYIEDKLKGIVETMLRVIDQFKEYVLFAYRYATTLKKEHLIQVMQEDSYFIDTLTRIIEQGVQEKVFIENDAFITANMISIMIHSWGLKQYNLNKYPLYYFQESLVKFILNGLSQKRQ